MCIQMGIRRSDRSRESLRDYSAEWEVGRPCKTGNRHFCDQPGGRGVADSVADVVESRTWQVPVGKSDADRFVSDGGIRSTNK